VETRFATPGGTAVRSAGGMLVSPDLAFENVDFRAVDALVICGGTIWKTEAAPDLTAAVRAVRSADRLVAGICDGTLALARTGVLDDLAHTSNGAGYLDESGYRGQSGYRDVPHAVADR